MSAETFDFGEGPVPAHRHINPDGSLGGWVADTARVTPHARLFIGRRARIVGGDIRGGAIRGGTILGGDIYGGTVRGGTIYGGIILGGTIRSGTVRGGIIHGGDIRGGTIYGGTIYAGTILGGTIRDGAILAGTILGGTIRGGTILGGTIRSDDDIAIAGPVGSRGDMLCMVRDPEISGGIRVTTGCFSGSWDEFRAAVERTHSAGSRHRQKYQWIGAALYATITAGQSSRGG